MFLDFEPRAAHVRMNLAINRAGLFTYLFELRPSKEFTSFVERRDKRIKIREFLIIRRRRKRSANK